MSSHRIVALAAVLAVASVSGALAQAWPQQSSSGQLSNPWQQQQPQANSCTAFVPMKEEAERTVVALNAANQRKAPREEFCQLFQRLANATGKMLKFLEQNKTQCNVPNDALVNVKGEYNKSLAMRKQACSQAPAAAATPSLSDVLGSPVLPDSSTNKPNTGTFNTMTGNPLTR